MARMGWNHGGWLPNGLQAKARSIARFRRKKKNAGVGEALRAGQRILIPHRLLSEALKRPTPGHEKEYGDPYAQAAEKEGEGESEGELMDLTLLTQELRYGRDAAGPYAEYRLKKGEALYTAVVVRFTDYQETADVQKACQVIQERSGIRDVRKMEAGERILIPMEMLSDRYQPQGTEQREQFEKVREEAWRLEAERVQSKDLEGV